MHRVISGRLLGALVTGCLLLTGCGGGSSVRVRKDPFAYDPSQPLLVRLVGTDTRGPDDVTTLTYAAADKTQVPALFALPSGSKATGCLMFQPGVGAPKQSAASIWPTAAGLGLAVFTIDPRYTGARAEAATTLEQVLSSPQRLISFLRSDVVDLRRGLDYLERQASCHHNIGYLGIGVGANLGVLLAGEDSRIGAAILCSLGATWRAALFYSPRGVQAITNDPAQAAAAAAELAPFNPEQWIPKIAPRPVMIVAGLSDPVIAPVDALDLAAAAGEPKALVLHAGGQNPFAGPSGPAVASQVETFLRRTLLHEQPAT